MTKPSFFWPAAEQKRSAAPTRAYMPREASSDAWAVSLAQHVDPRRVSAGQTFALMALGFLASLGLGLALSSCEPQSIDRAQARFEHRDKWPTPADFAGWRSSGALKCKDFPSLRICEAAFSIFEDGKPVGKDRIAFACSPDDCQWVDP